MSKLDFRKKKQYIGNIYVWKEKDGYGVGMNGTSEHYKVIKENVYNKINELKQNKDFRNGI